MPLTEYACPACSQDAPGQIMAGNGALTCQKNPAHVWNDVKTFRDLNPQKRFTVAPPTFPAQVNHVKYEITIPLGVKTQLETKYAGRANQTVAGVLEMLAEGDVLVIPESDRERIRKLLNQKPESSAELFGIIFALDQQAQDAKNEAETVRKEVAAYEGRTQGAVLVDLGDVYADVQSKAREASMPVKMYVEEKFKAAIRDGWF